MEKKHYVSVHGGHSGQFCHHAKDMLEEIVQKYISLGYDWVGITEHVPGISEELLYPDQKAAQLTPDFLLERFARYMKECRRLQEKYRDQITLFAAMESETYSGYEEFMPMLIKTFQPDYIVGSVHFVGDMGFDYSAEQYQNTAEALGGHDAMYCEYFDMQHEMLHHLKPAVVGHFDLVRIFDPDYRTRIEKPAIKTRIIRNLEVIKKYDLIMDYNLRALYKGAEEPYISDTILRLALEMGISVVPGDDSHGLDNIHSYMDRGIATLDALGFNTNWPCPTLYRYDNSSDHKRCL